MFNVLRVSFAASSSNFTFVQNPLYAHRLSSTFDNVIQCDVSLVIHIGYTRQYKKKLFIYHYKWALRCLKYHILSMHQYLINICLFIMDYRWRSSSLMNAFGSKSNSRRKTFFDLRQNFNIIQPQLMGYYNTTICAANMHPHKFEIILF